MPSSAHQIPFEMYTSIDWRRPHTLCVKAMQMFFPFRCFSALFIQFNYTFFLFVLIHALSYSLCYILLSNNNDTHVSHFWAKCINISFHLCALHFLLRAKLRTAATKMKIKRIMTVIKMIRICEEEYETKQFVHTNITASLFSVSHV